MTNGFSELINYAAECAYFALTAQRRRGKFERSQINKILEILNSTENPKDALVLCQAFIIRQMGRGEIEKEAGKKLLEKIQEIENRWRDKALDYTRKFIGLVKWLYESVPERQRRNLPSRPITNFNDFIRMISQLS